MWGADRVDKASCLWKGPDKPPSRRLNYSVSYAGFTGYAGKSWRSGNSHVFCSSDLSNIHANLLENVVDAIPAGNSARCAIGSNIQVRGVSSSEHGKTLTFPFRALWPPILDLRPACNSSYSIASCRHSNWERAAFLSLRFHSDTLTIRSVNGAEDLVAWTFHRIFDHQSFREKKTGWGSCVFLARMAAQM